MLGNMLMPTPSSIPVETDIPFEPTWLDLANFWVNFGGAFAGAVIAIFAVWLTVATARATNRRDDRARREAWVRDYMFWLDDGAVYMASGMDAAILTDRAWIKRGQELESRARLLEPNGTKNNILESKGASAYMTAHRTAREYIEKNSPPGGALEAATAATKMLKFWAEGWVDNPKLVPGDITEWIAMPSTDKPARSAPPESEALT